MQTQSITIMSTHRFSQMRAYKGWILDQQTLIDKLETETSKGNLRHAFTPVPEKGMLRFMVHSLSRTDEMPTVDRILAVLHQPLHSLYRVLTGLVLHLCTPNGIWCRTQQTRVDLMPLRPFQLAHLLKHHALLPRSPSPICTSMLTS